MAPADHRGDEGATVTTSSSSPTCASTTRSPTAARCSPPRSCASSSATCSWAHLDIAGPAFNDGRRFDYTPVGGTGAGVRTLVHARARPRLTPDDVERSTTCLTAPSDEQSGIGCRRSSAAVVRDGALALVRRGRARSTAATAAAATTATRSTGSARSPRRSSRSRSCACATRGGSTWPTRSAPHLPRACRSATSRSPSCSPTRPACRPRPNGPWWERTPGGDWDALLGSGLTLRCTRPARAFHYSNVGLRRARPTSSRCCVGPRGSRRSAPGILEPLGMHGRTTRRPGAPPPGSRAHPLDDRLHVEPHHDAGVDGPGRSAVVERATTSRAGPRSPRATPAACCRRRRLAGDGASRWPSTTGPGAPWADAQGLGLAHLAWKRRRPPVRRSRRLDAGLPGHRASPSRRAAGASSCSPTTRCASATSPPDLLDAASALDQRPAPCTPVEPPADVAAPGRAPGSGARSPYRLEPTADGFHLSDVHGQPALAVRARRRRLARAGHATSPASASSCAPDGALDLASFVLTPRALRPRRRRTPAGSTPAAGTDPRRLGLADSRPPRPTTPIHRPDSSSGGDQRPIRATDATHRPRGQSGRPRARAACSTCVPAGAVAADAVGVGLARGRRAGRARGRPSTGLRGSGSVPAIVSSVMIARELRGAVVAALDLDAWSSSRWRARCSRACAAGSRTRFASYTGILRLRAEVGGRLRVRHPAPGPLAVGGDEHHRRLGDRGLGLDERLDPGPGRRRTHAARPGRPCWRRGRTRRHRPSVRRRRLNRPTAQFCRTDPPLGERANLRRSHIPRASPVAALTGQVTR